MRRNAMIRNRLMRRRHKELEYIDDGYRLRVEKATAKRFLEGEKNLINLSNGASIDVFGPKCAEYERETVGQIVSSLIKSVEELEKKVGSEVAQGRLESFANNNEELDMRGKGIIRKNLSI